MYLPVLGWHGDVPSSRKQRFLKNPAGVLIITPESLEALFVTRGTAIPALAALVGDAVEIRARYVGKKKTDRRDAEHILKLLIERLFPRMWYQSSMKSGLR